MLFRETPSEPYFIETEVTSKCSLACFSFVVLPRHSAFISTCVHPLPKLLFAISNLFTCFLISNILVRILGLAFKQCCVMKCIGLSLRNQSNPKAMLIYTCCQCCVRTVPLNGCCLDRELHWQPVLSHWASCADNLLLHCVYPSEAIVLWSI